jgi:hypothetical protein
MATTKTKPTLHYQTKLAALKVAAVRKACHKLVGLLITLQQAKSLMRSSRDLRRELKNCTIAKPRLAVTLVDTWSRDLLTQVVVDYVMDGHRSPTAKDSFGTICVGGWHWPCNGSRPAYRWEFYRAFTDRAQQKQFRLCRWWRDFLAQLERDERKAKRAK